MSVTALIVAAGSGSRMGSGLPKQYRTIGGKAVLAHAVGAMASHPRVDRVRIVINAAHRQLALDALGGEHGDDLILGGAERSDSVRLGLEAIEADTVLVHDAARPFCPPDVIDRLLDALDGYDGAVPALPVSDTLAKAGDVIEQPVDRTGLVRVQTPQAFRRSVLIDAIAHWPGGNATDESTVVRAAGGRIAVVSGDAALEKLTTESDWARAEAVRMVRRTGMGFDVHAFSGPGPVVMGGIEIPHERGLAGHSDADVVFHSITDALLGAAALGDIGQHFPPSDPRWKDADSALFLDHAASLVRDAGGQIDFVDCTVICEAPRIGPYRDAMRNRVAEILGIPISCVSMKATTTERLGFTGRGEGIAAQAVASIRMSIAP